MSGNQNAIGGQGGLILGKLTPALNTEFEISVPAGEIWRINYMSYILATDANNGDRQVTLQVFTTGDIALQYDTNIMQKKNFSRRYDFVPDYEQYSISMGGKPEQSQALKFPSTGFWFDGDNAGFNGIKSETANLQVGDQFTIVSFQYVKWVK